MTEQYSPMNEVSSGTLQAALGGTSRPTLDVAHGDGEVLLVGDGKVQLEIYPGAGVARVTTTDARVELFRVPRLSINEEAARVIFEQGENDDRTRLMIRRDGRVSFVPVLRGLEAPTNGAKGRAAEQVVPPPSQPSTADTARPEGASDATADPKNKEAESLQLQGRLGRDPWYTNQGDEPLAGFPLAVNDEQGKATWHRVVTLGDVAEQVHQSHGAGQIRKGRLVQVTGTQVTREEETARGGTRKIIEFHASAVRRVPPTTKQR